MSGDFRYAKLCDVTAALKDGTHGTHGRVTGGVPLLSAKNIRDRTSVEWDESDDRISEAEYRSIHRHFKLESDDLLLTIVGSLGRRAIHDGARVTFQRSVAYIRCDGSVAPRFLFHAIGAPDFQQQLVRRSNATAQAGLYLGELAQTRIPLPPRPEQTAIAGVLDTVDEAICSTEQVIAKLDQVKRGLLHDLLTRGIDDNGELRDPVRHPERFKDSPLGRIPKAWEVLAVSRLLSARFPGEWGANPVGGRGNVKVLRSTNLDSEGHINLTHGAERVVASRLLDQKRLRDGDLLLEAAGGGPGTPVGRVACFTEPSDGRIYCVSNFFRTLRPHRPLVVPTFLNWLLLSRYRHPSIWRCQQQTTGIINLKMAEYERTLVRVPPKGEQNRAITVLQRIEARENGEAEGLQKLHLLKKGLMDDLLTGRVRVPLSPRTT